jgi:hypothetical protein
MPSAGNDGVNGVDVLGMAKFYVYFVGDSLTHAYIGEELSDGRILNFTGYKELLKQKLDSVFQANHEFEYAGVGQSGAKIEDIVRKLNNSKNNKSVPPGCEG